MVSYDIPGARGLGDALKRHFIAEFRVALEQGRPLVLRNGPVISAICYVFDCGFPVIKNIPHFSSGQFLGTKKDDSALSACSTPNCQYRFPDGAWNIPGWNPRDHEENGLPGYSMRLLLPRLSDQSLRIALPHLLDKFYVGTPAGRESIVKMARDYSAKDPFQSRNSSVPFIALHFRTYLALFEGHPVENSTAFMSAFMKKVESETLPSALHKMGSKGLEFLYDESLQHDGPDIFCTSDSIEVCQLLHRQFANRNSPIKVHFFNITAVHIKHANTEDPATTKSHKRYSFGSIENFNSLFTFLLMSRARVVRSTGSDYATSAIYFGDQSAPPVLVKSPSPPSGV